LSSPQEHPARAQPTVLKLIGSSFALIVLAGWIACAGARARPRRGVCDPCPIVINRDAAAEPSLWISRYQNP
jgi:hypothetical protein